MTNLTDQQQEVRDLHKQGVFEEFLKSPEHDQFKKSQNEGETLYRDAFEFACNKIYNLKHGAGV